MCEENFCKDCKHTKFWNRFGNDPSLWRCYRTERKELVENDVYLLSGPPKEKMKLVGQNWCDHERTKSYGACGKEGKFFEPRKKRK